MAAPTVERCEGIKRNRREHSAHPKHRRRPQPAAAPAPVGTLHPVGTELVAHHEYARVLTEETGDTYTLATGIGGTPAITSGRTGRIWTLDWEALIDLAVQAGIDKEG